MSVLGALLNNPGLFMRHRNIFLLSHMRANTSMLGHIMGSHPEIEGYYEMHIGYYGWKSLWRQKLVHFGRHDCKRTAHYMFDKILHDGHHVDPGILQRPSSRTMVMLRPPERAIKSLIVLYSKHLPRNPEATVEGATKYYVDRVTALGSIAETLPDRFMFIDSDALIHDTKSSLEAITSFLALHTPLEASYKTFENTGQGTAGDHSHFLKSGTIVRERSNYDEVIVPQELLDGARAVYDRERARLVNAAASLALANDLARLHDGRKS